MELVAFQQLEKWKDLQLRFQPYITQEQFANFTKIIKLLEEMYDENAKFAEFIFRKDESERKLIAIHDASVATLTSNIKPLISECLELLRNVSSRK